MTRAGRCRRRKAALAGLVDVLAGDEEPFQRPDAIEAVQLIAELRAINMMASPHTAALAWQWIAEGELDAMEASIRQENRLRQAVVGETLRGLDVRAHSYGHHHWLRLPEPWRRSEFGAHARQLGLSVILSDTFSVGPASVAIRDSLGAASDAVILRYGLRLPATLLAPLPGAINTVV